MKRDFRKNINYFDSKVITISVIGVLLLATIVFWILMYSNSINKDVRNSQLSAEQIASISENEQESQFTSSNYGKSVEEGIKEQEKNEINNVINENSINNNKIEDTVKNTITTTSSQDTDKKISSNTTSNSTSKNNAKTTEVKKEISFQKPIQGEIVHEFAKDNLIYSNTLAEWVTHLGIDIKADKGTVVQAAEDGIIKSIKNDPRYGLTIVISHQDGFETVYSNLLSSEFVKEKEKVTKGQSIGTVGNTAVFESAEEPHLHFEILKDSAYVDPNIYLK